MVDGMNVAGTRCVFHREVADRKEDIVHHRSLSFGLKISMSPSPIMVKASTTDITARPGNVIIHHAFWMFSCPRARSIPQSGVSGGRPRPRKLKPAPVRMASATLTEKMMATDGMTFGNM